MNADESRLLPFVDRAERALAHPRTLALLFLSMFVMVGGVFWPPLAYAMLVPLGAYVLCIFVVLLIALWVERS